MAWSRASGGGSWRANGSPCASTSTSIRFDGDGVVEFGQTTAGARQVGIGLNDQESIGIAAGPEQLRPGGAVVKGEVDRALGVRWGGLSHHDPGCETLQNRGELAESTGDVLDAMTLREKDPLGRAEEATTVGDPGLGQHVVVVEEKGPAEDEVLPVVASTEGGQKGVGIGWPQSESDSIDGPHQLGCLVGRAGDGHDGGQVSDRWRPAILRTLSGRVSMDVAIAGSSGFVGQALAARLLDHGHGVIALGRSATSLSTEVRTLDVDVGDEVAIRSALTGVEAAGSVRFRPFALAVFRVPCIGNCSGRARSGLQTDGAARFVGPSMGPGVLVRCGKDSTGSAIRYRKCG